MARIALEKYVSGCCEKMKSNVPESEIIEHVEGVYKSGDYNDLATRIVYDVARAARYKPFEELSRTDYLTILNDNTLTSLYKKAFKSAFPSVWEDIKAKG
jgi:hypothetical protein